MLVLKFGGTSVANAKCFINVYNIVKEQALSDKVTVVLSAPSGVTNLLVGIIKAALNNEDTNEYLNKITTTINNILIDLSATYNKFDHKSLKLKFDLIYKDIANKVEGIKLLGQCPEYTEAMIESLGEVFSINIFNALLQALDQRPTIINPQNTLYCQGDILEANVNIELSKQKFDYTILDQGTIFLMAGFSGVDEHGKLVLLGRNGSDYSAAALASIIHAKECQIWTDVDGVYSTDPKLVADAKLISNLSYNEAMELSYFGAKVLHPKTIRPLAMDKIKCLIKNTKNPSAKGSLISDVIDPNMPIKGISDLKNICLINISGSGMKGMVGMAGRLFTAVSNANISIILITQSSSECSISFCVYANEVNEAVEAIDEEFKLEFKEKILDSIEILRDKAIISVVGDGMSTNTGTAGRFFRALAQANININAIAQGSSESSISAVISSDKVKDAIQICHSAFFAAKQFLDLLIVGTGGVGAKLIEQIKNIKDDLEHEHSIVLRVVGVANSKHFIMDPLGLELENIDQRLKASHEPCFDLDKACRLIDESNLINPVFVDCTSSDEIANMYVHLLNSGFHVVTPNKKANTGSYEYYKHIRQAAVKNNRKFLYEANVGAGLPIINTLQNLLYSGDSLISFNGILSGTLSYILGLIQEGKSLSEATLDAYNKGYTEPNPADDLMGMDVARKLLILARECGYELEIDDIKLEPLVDSKYTKGNNAQEVIESLKQADPIFIKLNEQAQKENKTLRYVASIENGKCSCKLMAVDKQNPLFEVKDGNNALAFSTMFYNPIPLVITGYGAGAMVTSSGVLADILKLQNWTREA